MGSVSSVSILSASRACELATPFGLLACLHVRALCRLVVAPLLLHCVHIAVALVVMTGREAMCAVRWFDARPPLSEKCSISSGRLFCQVVRVRGLYPRACRPTREASRPGASASAHHYLFDACVVVSRDWSEPWVVKARGSLF